MKRSTRLAALVLTLVALIAAIGPVNTPAAGASDAPVRPEPISLSSIENGSAASQETFSPSFAGLENAPTNPERAPRLDARPAGQESVLPYPSCAFGDDCDGRKQITDTTQYPSRAIGQIEYVEDAQNYICTGWLIDMNTILTAGHCVYPAANDQIDSATFAAGRNGATDPYGSPCNVIQIYSPDEWKINQIEDSDWGLMQLDCPIGTTVGWFGYFWIKGEKALKDIKVHVRGYPADAPDGTMWDMAGKITISKAKQVFYKIDTFGGQSGAPIYQNNRRGCGVCSMGLHAYGVHGGGAHFENNHGTRITKNRFNTILSIANANDV